MCRPTCTGSSAFRAPKIWATCSSLSAISRKSSAARATWPSPVRSTRRCKTLRNGWPATKVASRSRESGRPHFWSLRKTYSVTSLRNSHKAERLLVSAVRFRYSTLPRRLFSLGMHRPWTNAATIGSASSMRLYCRGRRIEQTGRFSAYPSSGAEPAARPLYRRVSVSAS